MNDLIETFRVTVEMFNIPLEIWGFEFTFWQIFLFSGFGAIVAWLIGKIISGG